MFSEAVERNFPTAHLPEPVYMEVPKLILAAHPELAGCYAKVHRALYGLAHSPRSFNKHLDKKFCTVRAVHLKRGTSEFYFE